MNRIFLALLLTLLLFTGCEAISMSLVSTDPAAAIPAADVMPSQATVGAEALADFASGVLLHEESDRLLAESRGASKAAPEQRRQAELDSAELWKQAVERYESALKKDGTCAAACQRLSSGYFDRGDATRGLAWLKRVADLKPGDFSALFSLGIQSERAGRVDDAVDAYTRAERAKPEGEDQARFVPVVVFELARLLEQQGKPAEAVAAWERFGKIKPLDDSAYEGNRTLVEILGILKNHVPVYEKIADLYRKMGKPDQAVAAWREALRERPDFAEALLRIAEIRRDSGNLAAAVDACKEYIEKQPTRLDGMSLLVELYKAQGKLDEAVTVARDFLKAKPFLYQLHYMLGTIYEQQNEPAKALAEYDAILRDGKPFAPAYLRAAALASKDGKVEAGLAVFARGLAAGVDDDAFYDELDRRVDEAAKVADVSTRFRAAVAPDRQDFAFYYILGRLGQAQKRPPEAEASFREALRLKPDYSQAVVRLASILIGDNKAKDAAALLGAAAAKDEKNMLLWRFLADAESSAGNPAGAVAAMKRVLVLDPANAENSALYVSFLGDAGRFGEAEAFLEKKIEENPDASQRWSALLAEFLIEHDRRLDHAADIVQAELDDDPDNADLVTLLGRVRLKQKDYAAAAEAFRRAAKLDPGNLSARVLVAGALEEGEKLDEAEKELRAALAEKPDAAGLQSELARFLVRTKRAPDEGIALLRKVAVAEPDEPGSMLAVASAYTFLKRHAEALAVLQGLAQKFPDYVPARYSLAMTYDSLKDFPKAETELKAVLAKDPADDMAANALGFLYADRGTNLDEAARLVGVALAKEPKNGAYLDSMGWVWFRKGDMTKAVEYLTKAFEQDKDAVIADHLGDACYRLGRKDEALSHYQDACKLDKDGDTAVIKKIEAMKAGKDPLTVTK